MKINRFEEMQIWIDSISIAKEVYNLTSVGKFSKDYFLRDQIQRSVVSISSNIAEGFERSNNNEFIRFLNIAKGSAGEARSQIHLAFEIGLVNELEYQHVKTSLTEISKQIGAFIKYLKENKKKTNL